MDFETAAVVLSWLAIGLLGLAMAGLMRQVQWLTAGGRSLQHVGPTTGSFALSLPGVDYGAARETVVLFLTGDCPLCARLAPEARELALSTAGEDLRLVVAHVDPDGPAEPGETSVTEDQMAAWQVSVTPFAVRIGQDARVVDAGHVDSIPSLRGLVGRSSMPQEVAA